MSKEWYLLSSSTKPNSIGGYENEGFQDYKDDAFSEALETDIATNITLYNHDLSESQVIRCIIQGNSADTMLKSMERIGLFSIGTVKAGMYVFFENRYWLIDGLPGTQGIYEKATMCLCQYNLRWQNKNGDIVEVNGSPIYNEEKVYYLLNKPRGVISSVSDEKNRKTVIDLMPHVKERIYPVGRLDWDTTGLLILTNDGDFTDKMIHPRNEIDKVYLARVKGIATKENLRPLTRGVVIDGKKTKPARYNIIKVDHEKNRSVVELTIHEGRNHQVKKMFESVGLLVDKLSRTRFGTLDLTGLRPGESRRLNKKEISQLHNAAVNKVK